MKKILIMFAVLLFVAVGVKANADVSTLPNVEKPVCEAGYTFQGELVQKKICEKPKPWESVRPRDCKIIWSWVGECVKDGDIVSTSTPPVVIPGIGLVNDMLIATLNAQCKDEQIVWSAWSSCNKLFNMQFRYIQRDERGNSIFNGCVPTGLQQSTWLRVCE